MRAVAEYIQHAIDCRILAERMTQPQDKKLLEELAKAWERIAALRERDLIDTKDAITPAVSLIPRRFPPRFPAALTRSSDRFVRHTRPQNR